MAPAGVGSSKKQRNRFQRLSQQQQGQRQRHQFLTVPSKSNMAERLVRSTVTARRIGVPSSIKSSALTVPTCYATPCRVATPNRCTSYVSQKYLVVP